MATLTAWKFDSPEGAAKAEQILVGLSKQELITVFDAATVEWLPGKKKPKTRQLNSLTGAGALGGAFWGLLFGILFFVPLLGLAVGAAIGRARRLARRRRHRRRLHRQRQVEGHAGDVGAVPPLGRRRAGQGEGRVRRHRHAELIHTNLSDEDEAKLREAFAEED